MLNQIDLTRTDLNLLTLFEVVSRECHVGRAAGQLNLSPSAVSHGLGRLRRLLNDPLFLRTPKGVVPTARALELAEPIAEILARVRDVISSAEPFDPATSTRRFIIGAPDSVVSMLLPRLLTMLGEYAPGIDIGVRQLLPPRGGSFEHAWEPHLSQLEARAMDMAIVPIDKVAPRFTLRTLYDEQFVAAARPEHPFITQPTLECFVQARHLVVSMTGDPRGFVDDALANLGLTRRVALTVPDFAMGLAIVADSDLITSMPRRFVAMHAARFAVASRDLPFRLPPSPISAVVPKAAMADPGIVWLLDLVREAVGD